MRRTAALHSDRSVALACGLSFRQYLQCRLMCHTKQDSLMPFHKPRPHDENVSLAADRALKSQNLVQLGAWDSVSTDGGRRRFARMLNLPPAELETKRKSAKNSNRTAYQTNPLLSLTSQRISKPPKIYQPSKYVRQPELLVLRCLPYRTCLGDNQL